MRHVEQPFMLNWQYAAVRGGETGAGLALAYSLLFVIYASIRSAVTIFQAGAVDAGVLPTILATAASILWTALIGGAFFGLVAILLGAISGVLIYAALRAFNSQHSAKRAFLLGLGITALVALLLSFGLVRGVSVTLTPETSEATLFWFGLPAVIYIAAGGVGGYLLNRMNEIQPRRNLNLTSF